jgi:hypothetical protein
MLFANNIGECRKGRMMPENGPEPARDGLLRRLGDLETAEADALLDEALWIAELGDDLAEQSWRLANELLVADPDDRVGLAWLGVHEWAIERCDTRGL